MPTLTSTFCSIFDKNTIWAHIKNLNDYNKEKHEDDKVLIQMNHLPKKLKEDKASLLEDYKKARTDGKNPKWRFIKDKGEYCYMINKTVFHPKKDNFTKISDNDDINDS